MDDKDWKKIDPHSWSATSKWMNKNNIQVIKNGEARHHWFFERNQGLGKFVPNWIKNQPWNTNPISREFNSWLASRPSLAWLGAPSWAPETLGGATIGMAMGKEGANDGGGGCECK